MALYFGTTGRDIITGTSGVDVIFGNGGTDVIDAGAGNDTIHVTGGNSTVKAGAGDDTVHGIDIRSGIFDGGAGVDTFVALAQHGGGTYRLDGGQSTISWGGFTLKNFENITLGDQNDIIYGSSGANVIRAGGGDDWVYGGGGNDTIFGGAGNDRLYGEAGNDVMDGGTGRNIMDGGLGYDTASYAGRSESLLVGADGKVKLDWQDADTLISVEKVISGDAGDQFTAGLVRDFDGGKGRDSYYADGKASTFDGGEGVDYAVYTASTTGVGVDLQSGTGWLGFATGDRLISVEDVAGSWHSDILRGSAADNFIAGLDGNDTLDGRGGNDTLYGGKGADTLTGGAGRDTFIFATNEGGDLDRITDFHRGTDTIKISGDANIHVSGHQSFTRLTRYEDPTNAAGFTAGTVNIRHQGGNTYVDVNSSDNTVNGVDYAEISLRIDGIHDLRLSDFDFGM